MKTKFSEKILQKIRQKNLRPRSKFFFVARNSLFWAGFILSIFAGAAGFAVILAAIFGADFRFLISRKVEFFFEILPIFWFVFWILFLIFAVANFRQTSRGWRVRGAFLFLGNFAASVFFGAIFLAAIGIEKIENLESRLPRFGRENLIENRARRFHRPDFGRLAGEILEISENIGGEKNLTLRDFRHEKIWKIEFENVEIFGEIAVGARVKIVGEKVSEEVFRAEKIGEFRRPPGFPPRSRGSTNRATKKHD